MRLNISFQSISILRENEKHNRATIGGCVRSDLIESLLENFTLIEIMREFDFEVVEEEFKKLKELKS